LVAPSWGGNENWCKAPKPKGYKMSSILTNNSAMVALQTLKSINTGLAKTQGEISTGKSVSTSADNSAVWAISKVMESDVKGFKAISDSLSLGKSTVAVARQAAETVTDLLTWVYRQRYFCVLWRHAFCKWRYSCAIFGWCGRQ